MKSSLNESEVKLLRRIDEILYYVWDPIGVSSAPATRDEYEGYVPHVLKLLLGNSSADSIANHLNSIATQNMGLGQQDNEHSFVVAELLIKCYDHIRSDF
jgi:hypothetical protein